MEEVKSVAKWSNNELVVPSLNTSLYMVSGPGALPILRNVTQLNDCLSLNIFHKLVLIAYVKPVVIWVFRRIKISMAILYEFVDFIKSDSNQNVCSPCRSALRQIR